MAGSAVTELQIKLTTAGVDKLPQLSRAFSTFGRDVKKADLNFKEFGKELKKHQVENVRSINNTRALANTWKELAASVEFGSKEFKEATLEAQRLNRELQKMEGRGGKGRFGAAAKIAGTAAGATVFGGPLGGAGALIGGVAGGVEGAVTGGVYGAMAGQALRGIGETATYAADIKKQRMALKLVVGDNDRYAKSMQFIQKTSKELAIPQEVITRQFTQLSASVLGAGGSMDDAEKSFLAVTSGIRGTGGSIQDMNAALTATSQVWSKGKVSAEELRQQLGERLPGAFTIFAASMDKTPAELDKALEQGKVTLSDFLAFSESLIDKYSEKAVMIAQSTFAAGDRMQTALSKLKESMGTLIQPIGAQIQEFMTRGIEALDKAVRGVLENIPKLISHSRTLLKLASAYAAVWTGIIATKALAAIIKGAKILLDIDKARLALTKARAAIEATLAAVASSPGLWTRIAAGGTVAVGAYALLDKVINDATASVEKLFTEIDLIGDITSGKLKSSIEDTGKKSIDIWKNMKAGVDSYKKGISDFSQQIQDTVQNAFKGMEDALVNFVMTGKMNFADFARSIIADLTRIFIRSQMLSMFSGFGLGSLFGGDAAWAGLGPGSALNSPTLPKGANGLVVGKNGIVPFAKGGVVDRPTLFPFSKGVGLMGEAGEEAVMPLRRGKDGRLGVEASGAGVGNIVVNVDASGSSVEGDAGQAEELGLMLGAAIQAEIINQQRPGGLLA
jgi:tape measure domain-containing protein